MYMKNVNNWLHIALLYYIQHGSRRYHHSQDITHALNLLLTMWASPLGFTGLNDHLNCVGMLLMALLACRRRPLPNMAERSMSYGRENYTVIG